MTLVWEKDQLWETVAGELQVMISGAYFQTYIRPCFIIAVETIDEERILIELACPSALHQKTIDERYWGQIKTALEKQLNKKCELVLKVKQKVSEAPKPEKKGPDLFSTKQEEEGEKNQVFEAGLNPKFRFTNFVVGNSNNLAYAAARGVVNDPGNKHNPLFLWGGVGVGKTHLMHAIGRQLLEKSLNVRAVTSEQFTNELVMTIRNKRVDSFKQKYRNVDALLIDDIQFFAGKESSQEEFFHTFNELFMKGKQIILTADRRPQDIEQVEQRLISRFLGGLTVDIGLPDYEMRLAILKQKCAGLKAETEEGALDLVARSVNTNARELEGILTRLLNTAEARKEGVTVELVEREIGVKAKREARRLRPQQVISLVAKQFEFKNKEILGKSRKAELVRARHIIMYLLRQECGLTLQRVARLVGDRDHTTVMHAVEKMDHDFGVNQEVREQIMKAKQFLYR